jgi:branched-chain amino acid transport system permease protein
MSKARISDMSIMSRPNRSTASWWSRLRFLLWWAVGLLIVIALPHTVESDVALTLMCQIGVMAVFALAYNLLLGQTGLLSFGHAAYFGLGAFSTMLALIAINDGRFKFPVTLLPITGAFVSALFAIAFGWLAVKRGGVAFAMITLGLAELVYAISFSFPKMFGGEGGLGSNRVVNGPGWFGITYASQTQMYYLIAGWALFCTVAIYALQQTPLGRMARAVRENPERVMFVGYDPRWIRYAMLIFSAAVSGIAGGLFALLYEFASNSLLSAEQSSLVLIMTFVGGGSYFLGPLLGATLITLMQSALSFVTPAWHVYMGLLFLVMVLYAPDGLAGIVVRHGQLLRQGELHRLLPYYVSFVSFLVVLTIGVVGLVEISYMVFFGVAESAGISILGLSVPATAHWTWFLFACALGGGIAGLQWVSHRAGQQVSRPDDGGPA